MRANKILAEAGVMLAAGVVGLNSAQRFSEVLRDAEPMSGHCIMAVPHENEHVGQFAPPVGIEAVAPSRLPDFTLDSEVPTMAGHGHAELRLSVFQRHHDTGAQGLPPCQSGGGEEVRAGRSFG
jgi:hypothetical protein